MLFHHGEIAITYVILELNYPMCCRMGVREKERDEELWVTIGKVVFFFLPMSSCTCDFCHCMLLFFFELKWHFKSFQFLDIAGKYSYPVDVCAVR